MYIYRDLELSLRQAAQAIEKGKAGTVGCAGTTQNDTGAVDFMVDQLYDGRSLHTFNVLDDFNRKRDGIEGG
ncbi:MAG: hypothetical protein E6Q62_07110 [Nitrosomonas sp.]|nr:MAG: hypothetical protein E6Q62_07110 [Nitrosomonas sp.]